MNIAYPLSLRHLAAGLALALIPGLAAAGERIERSAPLNASGAVEITNMAGSVEVRAWGRSEISLTGNLDRDVEEVIFDTDADRARIRVVVDERRGNYDADADLVIRAPAGVTLTVTSVSAEIDIEGIEGQQRLRSVSGDIETESAAETIDIENISGEVMVSGNGSRSRMRVSTVSGDLLLRDVAGELNVRSVSGDAEVEAGMISRASVHSTSGDVMVQGVPNGSADIEMETVSGDVVFSICGDRTGEFDLETFSGDIVDLAGGRKVFRDKYGPGSELRFSEGGSDNRVEIDTMSGNIELDDC